MTALAVVDAVHNRIAFCWQNMDDRLTSGTYLLGDDLTVLNLYVSVVSRFGPGANQEFAPLLASGARILVGEVEQLGAVLPTYFATNINLLPHKTVGPLSIARTGDRVTSPAETPAVPWPRRSAT